jgi:hypothetical protein
MKKEIMVEVLKAAGLGEEQLKKLHKEFERRHPAEHEEFLNWLGIPAAEALEIRKASR